jgi:hypothetical protein
VSIMGLAQMFWVTGNSDYSTAYQQIWWSLCECERHNHGGIMSGEQATGSPYNTGSVETCCTVTWAAMCVEMLKVLITITPQIFMISLGFTATLYHQHHTQRARTFKTRDHCSHSHSLSQTLVVHSHLRPSSRSRTHLCPGPVPSPPCLPLVHSS